MGSPDIADAERLAIFVFDSNKIKADAVHFKAFRPDERGERSFFRVDGLNYAEIARIGREVGSERNQTLHGWGIVIAKAVRALTPLQLKVDEPPDKHGVIIGWPRETQDERSLAQLLAQCAESVQFPLPPDH